MKKLILITCVAVLAMLSGCATGQYEGYVKAHEAANAARIAEANARAKAEETRFMALASAARNGSDSVKQSAVMALAFSGTGQNAPAPVAQPAIAAPVNEALEWAKLIVPGTVQVAMGAFSYKLGVVQSNNGLKATEAAYNTMGGIAGRGLDSAVTLGTTGINATAGLGATGIGAVGAIGAAAAAAHAEPAPAAPAQ